MLYIYRRDKSLFFANLSSLPINPNAFAHGCSFPQGTVISAYLSELLSL